GAAVAGPDDPAPPNVRGGDDGELRGDDRDVLVDVPAATLPPERARAGRDGGGDAAAAAGGRGGDHDADLGEIAGPVRAEDGGDPGAAGAGVRDLAPERPGLAHV